MSWAIGESWERRPRPADMFRHSISQSIHHWGVLIASSNLRDWAAEAVVAGGVNPAGSQSFGGFLKNWADPVTRTRKAIPKM
jgi:hypothetical protein